jgi:hypothetical protein
MAMIITSVSLIRRQDTLFKWRDWTSQVTVIYEVTITSTLGTEKSLLLLELILLAGFLLYSPQEGWAVQTALQ